MVSITKNELQLITQWTMVDSLERGIRGDSDKGRRIYNTVWRMDSTHTGARTSRGVNMLEAEKGTRGIGREGLRRWGEGVGIRERRRFAVTFVGCGGRERGSGGCGGGSGVAKVTERDEVTAGHGCSKVVSGITGRACNVTGSWRGCCACRCGYCQMRV